MTRISALAALCILLLVLSASVAGQVTQKDQIEKPKIFRDTYAVVTETDLNCSFFILPESPELRIVAAQGGEERILLSDGDSFWTRLPRGGAAQAGQLWAIVEVVATTPVSRRESGLASVAYRRGRARVLSVEKDRFLSCIEKACGPVTTGCFLIPWQERPPVMGKDLGIGGSFQTGKALTGRFIFFDNELQQIGSGNWALVDIGRENGLRLGQQLTVFSQPEKDKPARAVANVVVIDVGRTTATVKVLSCRDALRIGDLIQVREPGPIY